MKLIVFDNRMNVREVYKVHYDNGTFKYKESLFGKEKTLPIIIDLFRFLHIDNDTQAQEKFFKDIENSVYDTLKLMHERGMIKWN